MARTYTTAAQDAAFLTRKLAESRRTWQVGDPCVAARGFRDRPEYWTAVAAIDGEIVTLANGDTLHRSNLRTRS